MSSFKEPQKRHTCRMAGVPDGTTDEARLRSRLVNDDAPSALRHCVCSRLLVPSFVFTTKPQGVKSEKSHRNLEV